MVTVILHCGNIQEHSKKCDCCDTILQHITVARWTTTAILRPQLRLRTAIGMSLRVDVAYGYLFATAIMVQLALIVERFTHHFFFLSSIHKPINYVYLPLSFFVFHRMVLSISTSLILFYWKTFFYKKIIYIYIYIYIYNYITYILSN